MGKPKSANFVRATLDLETDPFLYGRVPHPFAAGFLSEEYGYFQTWGDNCIAEMMDHIENLPKPHRIYVHNGGGFDFWFMQDWITNPIFFINRRIAKCGFLGKHELRDSYRMIPIALGKFNKTEIDYAIMEEDQRNKPKNKKAILSYLYDDCRFLMDMVTSFIDEYGEHLTIGAAAIKHLKELHPNNHENTWFDQMYRPYYMGGRNQCFKRGHIRGPLKMYDVNSMYPYVMAAKDHPHGNSYMARRKIPDTDNIYFAKIIAYSKGALPIKQLNKQGHVQGLSFPHGEFEFLACSHEIQAGLELGLLKIKRVIEVREFHKTQRFDKYIEYHAAKKIEAEEAGHKGKREFSKLFMNNSYGKWGQDPNNYQDCQIFDSMEDMLDAGYSPAETFGDRFIGAKPAEIRAYSFNNVSIAASITSAARAELLRGINSAVNPIYCDTDSIVCSSLDADLHDTRLGAWKHEADFDDFYVAGKKMYAGRSGGEWTKKASKGVNLSHDNIRALALDSNLAIDVPIAAPTLRIAKEAKFISRKIRQTY